MPKSITTSCGIIKHIAQHDNVLLLQGSIGYFLDELANFLISRDTQVFKVNFNGGDEFFYKNKPSLSYQEKPDEWEAWLNNLIEKNNIRAIILFGQCRFFHKIAIKIARQKSLVSYVFEEGYLRPDYITLERQGVNAYSRIGRTVDAYHSLPTAIDTTIYPVKFIFRELAFMAIRYYLMTFFKFWKYPNYKHHRPLNPLTEGFFWFRSGYRKALYQYTEKTLLDLLYSSELHKNYFFVPLQVHNDSQIICHSHYECIEDFIEEIVCSFAHHAPLDKILVLKHHPMDRGYRNYQKFIRKLRQAYHLNQRLYYIHEGHLPTLLENAQGVITINSTVGLSAPEHDTPVKIMGEAIYAIPGIVSTESLDNFWKNPGKVNRDLYRNFKEHLKQTTQINAGFYTRTAIDNLFKRCKVID